MSKKLNIKDVIPLLKDITECVEEVIESSNDTSEVSEVIKFMKDITDDNWMYVRN